jgi:hypothetical protein
MLPPSCAEAPGWRPSTYSRRSPGRALGNGQDNVAGPVGLGGSTVTGAILTMLADIGTTVDSIRGLDGAQELEDAFKESPACVELHPRPSN